MSILCLWLFSVLAVVVVVVVVIFCVSSLLRLCCTEMPIMTIKPPEMEV